MTARPLPRPRPLPLVAGLPLTTRSAPHGGAAVLPDPVAATAARLRAAAGIPVRYHLVTLGCPKNTVDSERFERRLRALGCVPVDRPARADVLIANTCGFIEQSQEESINAVLRLGRHRRPGQALIAAGCLITLNRDELRAELPEVSAFFDPNEWDATTAAVAGHGLLPGVDLAALHGALTALAGGVPPRAALAGLYEERVLAALPAAAPAPTSGAAAASGPLLHDIPDSDALATRSGRVSAYLKVSDGCNAPCTFCIIPQIKGRLTSVAPEAVVAEALRLRAEGARELVLVAQDLTAYGEDAGSRDALPDLLRLLAGAVPDVWLRLMYAYPGRVSERLIATMAELPQVVKYLDVPLQHASAATLRRMRRPANMAMVRGMIAGLRAAMPDIALRTSLIVGFPGETEAEFQELLAFVEEIRFDHIGVFPYSQQERAVSGSFPAQVPERVKRERRRLVMETQQRISLAAHRALAGREMTVLVEGRGAAHRGRPARGQGHAGRDTGPVVTGRTYRDAPEVDGTVILTGDARPGEFVTARITAAGPYDLFGTITGPGRPYASPA